MHTVCTGGAAGCAVGVLVGAEQEVLDRVFPGKTMPATAKITMSAATCGPLRLPAYVVGPRGCVSVCRIPGVAGWRVGVVGRLAAPTIRLGGWECTIGIGGGAGAALTGAGAAICFWCWASSMAWPRT